MHRTLITLVVALMICGTAFAADEKKSEVKPEKVVKAKRQRPMHRLPNYFGDLVTAEQRAEIYKIQDEYAPTIREYREKLAAALKERNAKIHALLTPEQKEKLEKKKQETIAKRKAKAKAKEAKAEKTAEAEKK